MRPFKCTANPVERKGILRTGPRMSKRHRQVPGLEQWESGGGWFCPPGEQRWGFRPARVGQEARTLSGLGSSEHVGPRDKALRPPQPVHQVGGG